ncbi:MAG: chemotaxis protein [Flavipsychrobacter sp.]|jgi:two-component system CheB/CheR fusion protein|nr:chemotaxis protein [Flavipsychrobacter sp.]
MEQKKTNLTITTEESFYIVAIGASAGGLDAIQELFNNMPGNTGFGFVLIQHLSPDHKSLLREILAKHTSMQLFEAEDGMKVNPNCIYIIPSKKTMTIKDCMLVLKDKDVNRLPNNAIDVFFESLAADYGGKAAGIILSGTGTDGSRGIEAIKSKGGLIIVQDPMTAAFDGMPNSAIQTGCTDLILPPEMMGEDLIEYLADKPFLKAFNTLNKQEEVILNNILELILKETGHDFSQYKQTTLNRRLAKKMFEKGFSSIGEYYTHLLNTPSETHELVKEFLINVTKFFRDNEAFEIISKKTFPSIFEHKKPGDEVKFWVVACSTGEEAYSLAILLHEYLEDTRQINFNIKIFASDIDQDALNIAVKGCYSGDFVKDLTENRLARYFTKEGDMYHVIPTIRKMVVFAKHDVIKDPPFSKIDLLSCRNMLIYMNHNLQKSILRKLHFALHEDGFLFLGPSESPAILIDYFKEIDRKWKLYKCIFKTKTYEYDRYFTPVPDGIIKSGVNRAKNALNSLPEIFKETLLEEYNFTGILIDKDLQVKQAIGNFRNFLRLPEGNFNLNIQKLLHADLSIAVSMAARKAIKDNERVTIKNVKITEGDRQRMVNVVVKPYTEQKEYMQPFLFVVIEEILHDVVKPTIVVPAGSISSSTRISELEQELREVRENLQAIIEEVESANEEMQTSNEEIISTNEELQSTNEELQSLNEELHTVNAELQLKIKELIELNDDMNNYFENSDIGQILIDKNLLIRKFSPAATRQINLIPSDIGRSIADFSTNFKRTDFLKDVKTVMGTGKALEKELPMTNQKTFLMRINPYVRQDKTLDGVVVNFIDITDLKRLTSIIEAVFNNSPNAITALKAVRNKQREITDLEFTAANRNAEKLLGIDGELIGKQLLKEAFYINYYFPQFINALRNGERFDVEYFDNKFQKWYELIATKMVDGVIINIADVNDKKQASNLLKESYEKLKQTSEELNKTVEKLETSNLNLAQFASIASHDLKEPLRKIQLLGDLFLKKAYGKLEAQEKDYIDRMIKSSHRLQKLIDSVMDFSILTNSKMEKVSADLNGIIGQILEDVDFVIKEKNATINIGMLPTINAKAEQIRQLFQNLISNALKFSSDKPPVINIREVNEAERKSQPDADDKYVLIEVADNGIGFDETYSEKIFGLFQRLNGSKFSGTGIGLAICKKIVEDHEGFIKVNSKEGEGTRFVIALPK